MSEPSNAYCAVCNSRLSGDWTCPNCRLSPHVSDTFNGPVYLTNSGAFSTESIADWMARPPVWVSDPPKPTVDTAIILAAIERMEESFLLALSEVRNRLPPERPAPPAYTWRDPFSHDYRLGAPEND